MAKVPEGHQHWTGECDVTIRPVRVNSELVRVDTTHTFDITNLSSATTVGFEYKQNYWRKRPNKAWERMRVDDRIVPANSADRFNWAQNEQYDQQKLHDNSDDYDREGEWNFLVSGDIGVEEGGEYEIETYTEIKPDPATRYGSIKEMMTARCKQ